MYHSLNPSKKKLENVAHGF